MYGFPQRIQTRADVDLLIGYLGTAWATDEAKQRGVDMLQSLIDGQQVYVFDRVLGAAETPDGTEPEYKVIEGTDEGATTRTQFQLTPDPNALIHQLELTEAEAQGMIQQIQQIGEQA